MTHDGLPAVLAGVRTRPAGRGSRPGRRRSARLSPHHGRPGQGRDRRPAGGHRALGPDSHRGGHHLHRRHRRHTAGTGLPTRSHSPRVVGAGLGGDRRRTPAADPRAQRLPRRCVRRGADRSRRRHPEGRDRQLPGLPPRRPRSRARRTAAGHHPGLRPAARTLRQMGGAGGQSPGAVRSGVRGVQPADRGGRPSDAASLARPAVTGIGGGRSAFRFGPGGTAGLPAIHPTGRDVVRRRDELGLVRTPAARRCDGRTGRPPG